VVRCAIRVSPTFLGKRVGLTEWLFDGLRKGDSTGTILVCAAVGAVLGVVLEFVRGGAGAAKGREGERVMDRDTWKGLRDVADELIGEAVRLEERAAGKGRGETPALAYRLARWAEDIRKLTGEDPPPPKPMPPQKKGAGREPG
jgi:hypothetical protein